ncbi:MAG: hypothetical protein AAGI30_11205 [Planctomycetota bacterium]
MPLLLRVARLLAVCLGVVAAAEPCLAQSPDEPPPSRFDGQDFGGVDLAAPPRRNPLSLSARRGWTWTFGNADRLLLERDVRVSIGQSVFVGDRAVVWLEPISLRQPDGSVVEGEQIAVYFDDLRTPTISPTAVTQEGERVLVTAVLVEPDPSLMIDSLIIGRPGESETDVLFIEEGEARLIRLLEELTGLASDPPGARVEPIAVPPMVPYEPIVARPIEELFPDPRTVDVGPADRLPIEFAAGGVFTAYAPSVESATFEDGSSAVVLLGGINAQHELDSDGFGPRRTVELSASRAVMFLEGDGALRPGGSSDDIAGIYLEGEVIATNGDYTLRGSRIFYDPRTERAVALDAVFWTYDESRGLPLYVRADAIRQLASDQWTAEKAVLSNVAFAEPHFSIGASDVTVTRVEAPERTRTLVDARGVRFRAGDTTVFGVPQVKGEVRPSIIKEIAYGNRAGDNVITGRFDLYPLFGADPPEGASADLILDGFLERGIGAGLDVGWSNDDFQGTIDTYFINDSGEDRFSTGEEIERDNENRGMILADNAWFVNDNWSVFAEIGYLSDVAFVEAFFPRDAETRREYATSLFVRYTDQSQMFTAQGRGNLNDFIANEYLLQSRGYNTERLPEGRWDIVGHDLLGLFSYTAHAAVGRYGLRFHERTPFELGFFDPDEAVESFGVDPDTPVGTRLRLAGLTEEELTRVDTRHEITAPLRAGPVNIVPFAAGRFTVYDQDIADIGGSGIEEDNHRAWGALGFRAATEIVKVDESIRSELFDLDRIRHIIEPSITVWHAAANLSQRDLPLYDENVESIATGTAWRAGVRQTWQTKRGGPDVDRSVDWLLIDANLVFSTDDTDPESPFHSFNEARPEQSQLGDFFDLDWAMQLTDAVAILGQLDWDLDDNEASRTTIGASIDHGEGFSSFFEYRDLDAVGARRLIGGARYEITPKYAVGLDASYSFESSRLNDISALMTRRFPQWTVNFAISFDAASDRFSAGLALRPVGVGSERRLRRFTEEGPVYTSVPPLRSLQDESFTWGPLAN